jgi:flavin reductase (DIM6/NTAB) family NADH-FMN oxidoreductase RutF
MSMMQRIEGTARDTATEQDPVALRGVLGRFATGVTIITAVSPAGDRVGVTANSFNTLSLDPPLILWSLALKAWSVDVFRATDRFAVNILSASQHGFARQFARAADDKFAGVEIEEGLGGVPLIKGAAAYLECSVHQRHPGGDHELYIGLVERSAATDHEPLVYLKSRFGGFAQHD